MINARRGKRSYLVHTSSGSQFLRNRRFLRPDPGPGPTLGGPSPTLNQVSMDSTKIPSPAGPSQKKHDLRPRKVTFKDFKLK